MQGAALVGNRAEGSLAAEAVREHLAHVLASTDFDASKRNRRFLDYIVEETLAGRGDRIKAYSIALAVFDRDDGFEPQSDPIVRIEASRLRRSLERYYLLAGRDDPIRIEIPKGAYVPVFHGQPDEAADATPDALPTLLPPAAEPTSLDGSRPFLQQLPRSALFGLALPVALGLGWILSSVAGLQLWPEGNQAPQAALLDARPSILVAPFDHLGGDASDDYFAQGIAQDIVANLIRFKELVVFDARASLEPAQPNAVALGRSLGADYIVTGTIRRGDDRVRVDAQLVKTSTGASLWSQRFDEQLAVERLFEIQDGIAANVAATVAQPYGVVYRDARDQLQRQPPESLSAYECMLQAYAYRRRVVPKLHASARDCLEEAVVLEPDYANALAMLAMVYVDEFRFHFNPRPDQYAALDKALEMARRAVDTAPDDALARMALFETLFFRGELEEAFAAGEHAVALNPNNPEPRAMLGTRLAHSGQWERGIGLVEEALGMNPAPPGWYYFPLSVDAFRQGRDEVALLWAERINMPGLFWTHVLLAAIYGQLERQDDAARAAARLLEVYPDFEARALIELGRQHLEPAVLRRFVDGLRKAGLSIAGPTARAGELG